MTEDVPVSAPQAVPDGVREALERAQQTLDNAKAIGENATSQRALEYRLGELITLLSASPLPHVSPSLGEVRGARIYIDCEFNGWMGELVSFAMVGEDGREFYSVLPEPRVWDAWCFENVLPVLGKPPVASFADFRVAFIEFLRGYRNPTIVADWPADLYYFNRVLLGNRHEESILIPCRQELVNCDYTSAIPHNALEDARAICSLSIKQGDGN